MQEFLWRNVGPNHLICESVANLRQVVDFMLVYNYKITSLMRVCNGGNCE